MLRRCILAVPMIVWVCLGQAQGPAMPAQGPAATSATVAPASAPHYAGALQDLTGFVAARVTELGARIDDLHPSLGQPLAGVAAWRYLAFALLVILALVTGVLAGWVVRHFGARLTAKTSWEFDDLVIVSAAEPLRLALQAFGVWLALMLLVVGAVPDLIVSWCSRLAMTVVACAVLWYLYRLVDVIDHYLRNLAKHTDNSLDDTVVSVARKAMRVSLLLIGIIFIGNNILNWDITALLASAGVVGLALAFAAQDTIANFFGTVMVLIDRPFRVGERVMIEGADGPVESIGFRSTRIRTLDGHLVTLPNKRVADAKVENVGRRPSIKRVTTIGITYDTPVAKVHRAVEILREILANHRCMDPAFPPRVHFREFADFSLNIQFIAWFKSDDYWDYLAWCEEVNFEIMRRFETEGIEFAFPTSTTYLAGDARRPLTVKVATDHTGAVVEER